MNLPIEERHSDESAAVPRRGELQEAQRFVAQNVPALGEKQKDIEPPPCVYVSDEKQKQFPAYMGILPVALQSSA